MKTNVLVDMLNMENVYKSIYDMQGVRHSVQDPKKLMDCAFYIEKTMEEYGLKVKRQLIECKEINEKFFNIEGSIGNVEENGGAVILCNYDTSFNSMGANETVGIAIMLEIARVFSGLQNPPACYFVATCLKESPSIFKKDLEAKLKYNILDENLFFKSWETSKQFKHIWTHAENEYKQGRSYGYGIHSALTNEKDKLNPNILSYFNSIIPVYDEMTINNNLGHFCMIGAYQWLTEKIKSKSKISYCINFEEMGYFQDLPYSQKKYKGVNLFDSSFLQVNVNAVKRIGNFALMTCHNNSRELVTRMGDYFKLVNMPLVCIDNDEMPLYDNFSHSLFSDNDIPAVTISDTHEARYPFIGMMADCVDVLNYEKIKLLMDAIALFLSNETIQ